MKTTTLLFTFLTSAFMSCFAQYAPAIPKDTIGGHYTEGEIRRFLLKQEEGSPEWKLARKSRTSNTVGVTTVIIGAACLIVGGIGFSSIPPEEYQFSILAVVSSATMGFGAINLGIGTWQLIRADRKLDQAKKLYYQE